MNIQDIIEQVLYGKCGCLDCMLRREGAEMKKNSFTTLKQIEENGLDESAVCISREIMLKVLKYKTDMYIRASQSAAKHDFPHLAKAYGILAETSRKVAELHDELLAERDAKQEAMDAVEAADPQLTPEEELSR